MSFERAWVLWLAIPLAAVLARGFQAWRTERSAARRRWAFGAQCLLCLCLLLAAAGARWTHSDTRLAVVIAVDRSRSTDLVPEVDSRLRALLAEAPRSMRRGDLLGVVSFGREADTTLAPSRMAPDGVVALPPPPGGGGAREESDLAGAIQHSLGDVPADTTGRIVVISDGDETLGDARSAALLAGAAGVPVDVVALSRPARRDVRAVRLRTPERTEPGEPVDLALVVRASREGGGRLELIRDGARVGVAEARWRAGEDVVHLQDTPDGAGLHRYEVRVVPGSPGDDEVVGNETAVGYVRVAGGGRALVVDGHYDNGGGRAMAESLRSVGLAVDLVGVGSAPATTGEWGRYDLVVLSDVRARELDPSALTLLREQVRELGAGLWMVGSDRSFGPGGYGRSALEEVLPVTLDLRQQRSRVTVSVAIVIDRSGSMGALTRDGRQKLDLANEGAARSAAMLSPTDSIAIAHVDTEVDWTLAMRLANDPAVIARAARSASVGGGGILTDVGLRAAYEVLGRQRTTIRHVILLADGDDAEDSDRCDAMVRAAHAQRITTSVVAIGRGHDEANLARIARLGEGRYYLTEDARSLPAIFTEETVVAARNAIREEPFRPRFTGGAEVLRGVDPAGAPTVGGYVLTEARPRAEVLAMALERDPWVARWQAGAGRSAVLTSDVNGAWTQAFGRWPGSTALYGQMGLWLARGVHDAGARVSASVSRGRLRVEVDATTETGRWNTGLDLEARVVGPGGETQRVPLGLRGVGRYEAEVDAPRAGGYVVTVVSPGAGVVGVTGAEVVASAEVTSGEGDPVLMAALAEASGGEFLRSLSRVFAGPRAAKTTSRAMDRWLYGAALCLLLLEVAIRRMPSVSLSAVKARWGLWSARLRGAPSEPETDGTSEALAAVRARRDEAQRSAADFSAKGPAPTVVAPRVSVEKPAESAGVEGAPPATGLDALVAKKRERRR